MGIQINGITDDISAVDGGLTISDLEINQSGISTFNAGLDCNGDLDVDGQTNLDHTSIVGIVTISAGTNNEGLRITGQHNNCVIFTSPSINGSAGYRLNHHPSTNFLRVDTTDQNGTFTGTVAKFSSAGLDMADNVKLRLGTNQDLTLYHYGNDAYIDNADGDIIFRQGTSEKVRIKSSGVGIGENNPANLLHVKVSDTGVAPHASAQIVLERSGTNYLQFLTANNGTSGLLFGDADDNDVSQIKYDHNIPAMLFQTEGAVRLRINDKGHLGLNITPGSWDNTFKALEGGGNNKHGELFFQANGDWTTALGCNLYFNSGWKYRHTGAANWLEMKEDRTTFYMADSGSADSAITWLERLRIHSTGYITMPYQIAFFAYCSIGNHDLDIGDKFQFNTIPSSGNVAVNSNHTTFGGTNVFNTSTNTFTAPVAGLYSFTVTAYYRRTGDPLGPLVPRVNNTEVSNGNNNVMFFAASSTADGDTLSGTVILQLAANDAVTVHRRNHGTGTVRFYGPHSHFCGHLIG